MTTVNPNTQFDTGTLTGSVAYQDPVTMARSFGLDRLFQQIGLGMMGYGATFLDAEGNPTRDPTKAMYIGPDGQPTPDAVTKDASGNITSYNVPQYATDPATGTLMTGGPSKFMPFIQADLDQSIYDAEKRFLEQQRGIQDAYINRAREGLGTLGVDDVSAMRQTQDALSGIGQFDPADIDAYKNPRMDAIKQAMMDASAVQAQGDAATQIRSGAFGGSRAAVMDAQRQADLAKNLGLAEAQNYDTAMANAMSAYKDKLRAAELGLAGGEQLGNLALAQSTLGGRAQQAGLTDLTQQLQFGDIFQKQQAQLEAARQNQLMDFYAPMQAAEMIAKHQISPNMMQLYTQRPQPQVSPLNQAVAFGTQLLGGIGSATGGGGGGGFTV